ncbi:MAG: hypothetical protein KGJ66_06240 [Alphaproteobacteria bacterium]|nr:hypothetical protein [Alphaproteobacteria bacterium]
MATTREAKPTTPKKQRWAWEFLSMDIEFVETALYANEQFGGFAIARGMFGEKYAICVFRPTRTCGLDHHCIEWFGKEPGSDRCVDF